MISLPDSINGTFELLGGIFLTLNIIELIKVKKVRGIHWGSTIFFTSWGIWNIWYYPHLNQWASFIGGLYICLANVIWLTLRLKWKHN